MSTRSMLKNAPEWIIMELWGAQKDIYVKVNRNVYNSLYQVCKEEKYENCNHIHYAKELALYVLPEEKKKAKKLLVTVQKYIAKFLRELADKLYPLEVIQENV